MATKETPADPNEKDSNLTPKIETFNLTNDDSNVFKAQEVSEDQKIAIEKRAESKSKLDELVSNKFIPMFSRVVTTEKTKPATTEPVKTAPASNEAAAPAAFSGEEFSAAEVKEVSMPVDEPTNNAEVTDEPVKDSGKSFFGLKFDFSKMEKDPFGELMEFFKEHTRQPIKEETEEENEGPMVIVADFTLPYRCCEDYVCEDMCYTEDELELLEIPPFAKDDFVVTRKDTPVDIYPDLNDSHVFKNYIVVKEIDENQSFSTTAGGKVISDKSGAHPHFIYSPPPGATGVSDSFVYTLFNIKNKLSDTATVWIEVAEALPSFSMNTKVCQNAGLQNISVDPNGNDWNEIEIQGPGIEKIINTGTGEASFTFNPKFPGVLIGVNTFTLTLDGKDVQSIDVTVTEILANFSDQGEVISIDPASGLGTIAIHDQSLNVAQYEWQWQLKSGGPIQTGAHIPDGTRTVFLPLPNTPKNSSFILNVTLSAKSPEGCIDIKTMDVGIQGIVKVNPTFINPVDKACLGAYNITFNVDPKGNDWKDIEVIGNAVTQTTASGNPVWIFNPADSSVSVGPNPIRLRLSKKTVETVEMVVYKTPIADVAKNGTAQLTTQGKKGGFVFIKVNDFDPAMTYNFFWASVYGNGNRDLVPALDGTAALPFPDLPPNFDNFTIETLTLRITGAGGCEDVKMFKNIPIGINRLT